MYNGGQMRKLSLLLFLFLGACGSNGQKTAEPALEAVSVWPAPVGVVILSKGEGVVDSTRLDLGVIVFDPGVPKDASTHSKLGVFPKIRQVEAQYLPVVLRDALVASDNWGVVRVVPQDDETLELRVTGKIVHSDGEDLVVHIRAIDAAGDVWLDRSYHDRSNPGDFPALASGVPVQTSDDPFADLYRAIANDLAQVKVQFTRAQLANIRNVALLRYATSLSPEAFSEFLSRGPKGEVVLQRLPADNDPMMARVQRIRNQEYLFIDTVDEQYVGLYETMAPTYYLWRQYGRERAIFKAEYEQRAADRDSYGRRGSYIAMERTYNTFKNSKIQDQDLQELAGGFNNEVAPTVMEVSGRVFRLNGGLNTQYAEWREILRSIFKLETGLPIDKK
jgi:hypothetical protein